MQNRKQLPAADGKRGGAISSIDLVQILWRRKVPLIVCTLLAIGAGVAYCLLAPPQYESSADVLVVQKRPQAVTGEHQYESGFEDYLATHLAVIVSPLIVERAIDSGHLDSLQTFSDLEGDRDDLVEAIIDQLEAEGGQRDLGENANSIMTLRFRGKVAEECPIVIQALLKSYEDFHHEVYRGMSGGTVELIKQARDLLKNDLATQEEAYSAFRQSSPLVARGTDEVNPRQERLTAIEGQRSAVLLRRAEVRRQLLAIRHAQEGGADPARLLGLISDLRKQSIENNAPGNTSEAVEAQLVQLLDNEHRLLENYGPNHPHVENIRQRIEAARREFALPSSARLEIPTSVKPSGSNDSATEPVAVYTDYLEQELDRLGIAEGLLAELYDREHEAAKELSTYQLKDESFRRNIERSEALYDVVVNRLQEASLVKDFGGFETRVIAPPRLGEKVSPSRKIVLPLSALAGLLFGSMLALMIDVRDERFYSAGEILEEMGVPVVGQIPEFGADELRRQSAALDMTRADRSLSTVLAPRSKSAEAFRSLRTALFFGGLAKSSRVVQVSGAVAEDGASTVAANLAISLAQTGKRVLLIDANLKQQRQHQLFGLAQSESGFAAMIHSNLDPAEGIVATGVPSLALLSAGPLGDTPMEWFTTRRFGELIRWARDAYDYVLIDTEPWLAASDPGVIAPQTDGVLLTLRLSRDSRRHASQIKAMLDLLQVKPLGVVVNWLRGVLPGPLQRRQAAELDIEVPQSRMRSDQSVS